MTSADLSEFLAENARKGPSCGIGEVLRQLDPDKAARLQAALEASPGLIQHAAISRTVAKWGHHIAKGSVGRHRAGECSCARS